MTERGILFRGEMVRAILGGRKTQTRRIVKPQPQIHHNSISCEWYPPTKVGKDGEEYAGKEVFGFFSEDSGWSCRYGGPGDRLWVKETFYNDIPEDRSRQELYYRADGECCEQIPECQCAFVGKPKWTPSLFMPRWACRITLEITQVRVDRIQDISEEDAKAEGVEASKTVEMKDGSPCYTLPYQLLWNKINGVGSWELNPWVWVIEFRRIEP